MKRCKGCGVKWSLLGLGQSLAIYRETDQRESTKELTEVTRSADRDLNPRRLQCIQERYSLRSRWVA
jgi:hypothetical protein